MARLRNRRMINITFNVTADARFPGRTFLWTVHNGKMYGASFCGRRSKAEDAIRAAIAASIPLPA